MRLMFALLLIIVGVAQIYANDRHKFGGFDAHSSAGKVADKYPMSEQDKQASEKAVQHVEYFRRFIQTGLGYVPAMDPYMRDSLNPIHLDGNNTELKGTLELSHLLVTGAAPFTLNVMEVYLKTHRMDFEVAVPKIEAKAHFSAVNMIYKGFMFNTSGDIEVMLEDYKAKGAVSLVAEPSIDRYRANGLDVHVIADRGSYKTRTLIGEPPKKVVEEVRDAVLDAMCKAILEQMTSVLRGYTVLQVDTFMNP